MARPGPDPSVSDKEIIRVIVSARPPALGTTDISDALGISPQATKRHLDRLVDEGKLNTEKISDVNVWWPTPDGRALLRSD